MKKEITTPKVPLVEDLSDGVWAVRWNFEQSNDENGGNIEKYTCEEEIFNYPPALSDIRQIINDWHDKQVDGAIKHGYRWNDMPVLLTSENLFSFKSVFDLSVMVEPQLQAWDAAHPDLAGKSHTIETSKDENGNDIIGEDGNPLTISIPTGRPQSVLPATLRLGTDNEPIYYTFNTLAELQDFYVSGANYVQGCYAAGWTKKGSFDFSVYEIALRELL